MDAKQVSVLLKKLDVSFDQWKLQVLTGKRVLSDIITSLYPTDRRETDQLTEQLEARLHDLRDASNLMNNIVKEIQLVDSKFQALNELLNLTGKRSEHLEVNKVFVDFNDILQWSQVITKDMKEQAEMNSVIVSSICHLDTRTQALLHHSVWIMQPAISPQSDTCMSCVRHIVQQENMTEAKKG